MQKNKKPQGFILIEAIIAVGVLAVIFSGAMSLYMSSIEGIRISTDQAVATFLAQDAMELVIAKVQYNTTHNVPSDPIDWLDGLDGCTTCGANTATGIIADYVFLGETSNLSIDGNGLYTPGNGSIFTRSIRVEEINPDEEARVTVTVSWDDGSRTHRYPLIYNIYNAENID